MCSWSLVSTTARWHLSLRLKTGYLRRPFHFCKGVSTSKGVSDIATVSDYYRYYITVHPAIDLICVSRQLMVMTTVQSHESQCDVRNSCIGMMLLSWNASFQITIDFLIDIAELVHRNTLVRQPIDVMKLSGKFAKLQSCKFAKYTHFFVNSSTEAHWRLSYRLIQQTEDEMLTIYESSGRVVHVYQTSALALWGAIQQNDPTPWVQHRLL